jgi:hypothetical protein
MPEPREHISNRRLRTPRAAAIAGILFALLMITSFVLLQISIPSGSIDASDWLAEQAGTVTLALTLLPFAGIAYLWFMGVMRDRLGHLEDQFFSTLFFGSGLLYLAMTFASAAIAGGMLTVYAFDSELLIDSGIYVFSRAIIYKFNDVYAMRMAGMHMIVLGTIWTRTQIMPRWLALVTFTLALVQLVGANFLSSITLVFPAWVFIISAYILYLNFRHRKEEVSRDGLTLDG